MLLCHHVSSKETHSRGLLKDIKAPGHNHDRNIHEVRRPPRELKMKYAKLVSAARELKRPSEAELGRYLKKQVLA